MTTRMDEGTAPLLLPLPRRLLELGDGACGSPWASRAAGRLGALLAVGPHEPRLEDRAPLWEELRVHAEGLVVEAPELPPPQRLYDAYFTTERRGPTLDALVTGLVQATRDVLYELARPHSLAPVEKSQLLAGLQTAALLLTEGEGR